MGVGGRAARLGALAVAAVLAAGCAAGQRDTYLLAVERPFWYAVTEAFPQVEQHLRATLEQAGHRTRLLVLEDPAAALDRQLAAGRYRGVVLTPLLAVGGTELAAAHRDLRFVLLTWQGTVAATGDDPRPAALPANVTEVRFARTAAYTRAGRLAAAYLATRQPAKAAVVYAVDGGDAALARVAAFRAGFSAGAGGGARRLLERSLQPESDAGRLNRVLSRLEGEGVTLVYLEVGRLVRGGLEAVAREGMQAVVANWGERPGFEATVLISVDDDPAAALAAGLAAAGGERVSVPSRVVWGLAAPLPPDATPDWYDRIRTPDQAAPAAAEAPQAPDPPERTR